MLADPHGYWLALKVWAVIVGLLIWGMNAPHGALVICASEQDKRAIMALAPKLGRADVRTVKHDEVLTTDPADCEVCQHDRDAKHCPECAADIEDHWAGLEER